MSQFTEEYVIHKCPDGLPLLLLKEFIIGKPYKCGRCDEEIEVR